MNYKENSNGFLLRRGLAYIVDIIFVAFIASLISRINVINPDREQYAEVYAKYEEKIKDTSKIQEFLTSEEGTDLVYGISKYGVVYTFINAAVLVLYFTAFQRATGGQTLGKKLFKIKVVGKEDTPVKWWQLFVRSLIVYEIITDVGCGIAIIYMSKTNYIEFSNAFSLVLQLISYVAVGMLVFRQDGRGLHDLIVGTKVIDLKVPKVVLEEDKKEDETKVVEAKFEEAKPKAKKKTTTKKKSTKKSKE
jgi:uncharacterized RDD family membrane protein YckC